VVTVYALGDMMIYNRRKRREYYLEQAARHSAAVYEAQTALRHGTASEEQVMLIQNEEARRMAEAQREREKEMAKKEGVWAGVKGWLFEGLKRDEDPVVREGKGGEGDGDSAAATGAGLYDLIPESAIMRAVEEKKAEAVDRMGREAERETKGERNGGMLDRLGTGLVTSNASASDSQEAPPKQGGGWTSFMSRR
jgi:hypothetical protein